MGKYHRERARRKRADMELALGHQCARCRTYEGLTFDCVTPCGHDHHRENASGRMTFYWAQARLLNVQLLCESCNASKGDDSTDYRRPEDMILAVAFAQALPVPRPRKESSENPF